MFAISFLADTSAIWWFTSGQENSTPATWQGFKLALRNDFITEYYICRARRRLLLRNQVHKYNGQIGI